VLAAFGPVRSGEPARQAVRRLNDWYGLRDCPQAQEMIFADQGVLFPVLRSPGCLRYEIGTCLGPCVAACTRQAYGERVRAARAFLAGADRTPLDRLVQEMTVASDALAYEQAAGLRDRLAALQWLYEQLEQMRRLRADGSFVYPVEGRDGGRMWYLIHHGRAVAAAPPPQDDAGRRDLAGLIETVYHRQDSRARLESSEHLESVLLVASWFRSRPEERARACKPEDVLGWCRGAVVSCQLSVVSQTKSKLSD
jgi:excinuclease ABC subunit C